MRGSLGKAGQRDRGVEASRERHHDRREVARARLYAGTDHRAQLLRGKRKVRQGNRAGGARRTPEHLVRDAPGADPVGLAGNDLAYFADVGVPGGWGT